jgi:predicted regulator of Ras-like GTPase activity (Roadblock/LC7/MglB family)
MFFYYIVNFICTINSIKAISYFFLMDALKIESLNKELKDLETRSGIIGSAIVKRNGLLITSSLPLDIDYRKLGAMAATMFEAIETASSALGNDHRVYNLTIELEDFQLIIFNVGNDLILAALIDLIIDLGLIFIEIEESIKIINNIIEE